MNIQIYENISTKGNYLKTFFAAIKKKVHLQNI